jgi:hypothetical protein
VTEFDSGGKAAEEIRSLWRWIKEQMHHGNKADRISSVHPKGAPARSQGEQREPEPKRKRGRWETVALTVRLSRADWERLHQLAVSEGTSIQHLAVSGLSTVFASKGLPGLKS